MINSRSETQQDTLLVKQDTILITKDTLPVLDPVLQDTLKIITDSSFATEPSQTFVFPDTSAAITDSAQLQAPVEMKESSVVRPLATTETLKPKITDTTSVCLRSKIIDFTFHNSADRETISSQTACGQFPYTFKETLKQRVPQSQSSTVKNLKPGIELPAQPFQQDWIIIILLLAAFLYSLIGTISKNIVQGTVRFFLFRGINDYTSRDSGGFFNWQSTIKNFISFNIIGLFGYSAIVTLNIIPGEITGIFIWIFTVSIIIIAVTIRHIICVIVGKSSGEDEAFVEYLHGVYQSYRFSALILFVSIVLMFYSTLFSTKIYFTSGIIVIGLLYFIRIIRLLIIFLKRNISLFYLILYLCALEILPVLISVKYFSGLV
jgi:hypothetical protein